MSRNYSKWSICNRFRIYNQKIIMEFSKAFKRAYVRLAELILLVSTILCLLLNHLSFVWSQRLWGPKSFSIRKSIRNINALSPTNQSALGPVSHALGVQQKWQPVSYGGLTSILLGVSQNLSHIPRQSSYFLQGRNSVQELVFVSNGKVLMLWNLFVLDNLYYW